MRIDVTVDDTRLLARLRNPEKRIVFAIQNALNETAKIAQRAQQLHVQDEFTIRKPSFFFGVPGRPGGVAAKIDFAKALKGKLHVDVYVDKRARLLLAYFEAGAERKPSKGARVAVPIAARPSPGESVPPELYIQRLRLRAKPRTKAQRKAGTRRIFVGEHGTYQLPGVGILQRLPGRPPVVLYAFKEHVKPLRPVLKFHATVSEVMARQFPEQLHRQVRESLEYHGRTR